MDTEKYFALYFPEDMRGMKDEAYYLLQDIDSNYSKFIQAVLPQIIEICTNIVNSNNANDDYFMFNDFEWTIAATKKKKGNEDGKEEKTSSKG